MCEDDFTGQEAKAALSSLRCRAVLTEHTLVVVGVVQLVSMLN